MLVIIFCSAVGISYQRGSAQLKKHTEGKINMINEKYRKGTQNSMESSKDQLTSRINKSNKIKSMQVLKRTKKQNVIEEVNEEKPNEEE